MMLPQRAGDAENPAENKSSNGPPRAQSNAVSKVFCDVRAHVICRGYDSILLSARLVVNQGGTAKIIRP